VDIKISGQGFIPGTEEKMFSDINELV